MRGTGKVRGPTEPLLAPIQRTLKIWCRYCLRSPARETMPALMPHQIPASPRMQAPSIMRGESNFSLPGLHPAFALPA